MSTNKFKRALKNAARLPVRAAGRGNNRGFHPQQGEVPVVVLRVQVVGCTGVLSKDKNGFSDP
jgi:phosphatidylserine decarboxylase